MASIHDILNRQIANFSVLYVKLHHYHWYVKGASFYTLHVKFEELYNEAAGYVDELAERLLALGGRPVSRMADYLKFASVKEASGTEDADAMALAVADDFRTIAAELNEGIRAAEQEGDAPTADLLTGIRKSLDKHAWMLRAFVGQPAAPAAAQDVRVRSV
jgi:DNA-binding ferritin-like protein (oxidative damage protectant)